MKSTYDLKLLIDVAVKIQNTNTRFSTVHPSTSSLLTAHSHARVPIGCQSFCDNFILADCDKIIDGLKSDQTVMQIFRTCTAHKMTHLFAATFLTTSSTTSQVIGTSGKVTWLMNLPI